MTFDEFNNAAYDITMAYGGLVHANQLLREKLAEARAQLGGARKLAEQFADMVHDDNNAGGSVRPPLPWEEEK